MRGPDHPWIDQSHAPIYIMAFPSSATDEEVAGLGEARESWARGARHPCSWVVDMSRVGRVPPQQRKLFAEHLKRFEPHDIRYNRGSALVLGNPWLRGVVAAIFALSSPKFPHATFSSVEEALCWARRRLGVAA